MKIRLFTRVNKAAKLAFALQFTATVCAASTWASENQLPHDWMQTVGEWSDDEGDGTVQLIAVRQGLEDLRQTLTLRWTLLDRDKREFRLKSQTSAINICGSEVFQNVQLITFSSTSSEQIDLALIVRYLPESPDKLSGKSQLVFLSIHNQENQVSVLNCAEK